MGNPNANARFLKQHAVAVRRGARTRPEPVDGYVACETCRSLVVSKAEIADLAGTSPGSVAKWFARTPLRPDVAERIRSLFKTVED